MAWRLRSSRPRCPAWLGQVSRWAPSTLLLLVVVAVSVIILDGCTAPARYRVLSFFFDGVPPPEGWTGPTPGWYPPPEGTVQIVDEPAEQKITYYHKPYIERQCFDCHDREGTYQAPQYTASLCRRCHESYTRVETDDWVHGPVNQGDCSLCHQAHKSDNPGLLTMAQPAMCFNCHDPGFIQSDPMHAQLPADVKCSDCHDPHAAGNRLMLADSRTYARRDAVRKVEISSHAEWQRTDCARCHRLDEGNRVVENVNAVCLECHDPAKQASTFRSAHKPVLEGQCVTCHTPHKSTRPHLLHPTAEKMCLTCHSVQQVRANPDHPNVTRVDCLLCHAGHASDEPHLLRSQLLAESVQPSPPEAVVPEATVPETAAPEGGTP